MGQCASTPRVHQDAVGVDRGQQVDTGVRACAPAPDPVPVIAAKGQAPALIGPVVVDDSSLILPKQPKVPGAHTMGEQEQLAAAAAAMIMGVGAVHAETLGYVSPENKLHQVHLDGPPTPACELERLATLKAMDLLDAPPDPELESMLKLVQSIFQVPSALIALFGDKRIYIKEAAGLIQRGDFPWRWSFCGWTMAQEQHQVMVIQDATKDARFSDNQFVVGPPYVRSYCGAPLVTSNGHRIGTLCFADQKPRTFDDHQASMLSNFATMVVQHVEKDIALQVNNDKHKALSAAYDQLYRAIDMMETCMVLLDVSQPGLKIMYCNQAWDRVTGTNREALQGASFRDVMEWANGPVPATALEHALAAGQLVTLADVSIKPSFRTAHPCTTRSPSTCSSKLNANSCYSLDGASISTSLITSARPSVEISGAKAHGLRLMIKLRPAAQNGLDVPPGLAVTVPAYLPASQGEGGLGCDKYYLATIETMEAASAAQRAALMAGSTSISSDTSCVDRTSCPVEGLQLGQLLGRGSYGSVYSGKWFDSRVAVKIIEQDAAQAAQALEGLLGLELRHPYVVSTLRHVTRQLQASGPVFSDDTAAIAGKPSRTLHDVAEHDWKEQGSEQGLAGSAASSRVPSSTASPQLLVCKNIASSAGSSMQSGHHEQGKVLGSAGPLPLADQWTPMGSDGCLLRDCLGPGHTKMFDLSSQPGAALALGGTTQTWLLLEYCDRGCLQDAIDRGWLRTVPSAVHGQPNYAAILATAYEIASALSYLHAHGIVHGDLSAFNVLLTSSGTTASAGNRGWVAKAADFGLARSLNIQTKIQTATYGTITHQPPETLAEGVVSRETDCYAFGVLLWSMWTSSRPWHGLSHAQIIMTVASRRAALEFPPDTPAEYAELGRACLNWEMSQRPAMADLCRKLEALKTAELSRELTAAAGHVQVM